VQPVIAPLAEEGVIAAPPKHLVVQAVLVGPFVVAVRKNDGIFRFFVLGSHAICVSPE
jgi:hypothetical protein